MATLRERAEAALQNPNVQNALRLIRGAEGVQFGYATGFGNTQLASLADHPRERKPFKQTNGKTNYTTAAGAYQFLEPTWDDVAGKLGLTDFGQQSQDLAAVELIRRAGALNDVMDGNFAPALKKLGKTWASLPSSPYPQPRRSQEWVQQELAKMSQDGTDPTTATAVASAAPAQAPAEGGGQPAWSEQLAQSLNTELPSPVASAVDYAQRMTNLFQSFEQQPQQQQAQAPAAQETPQFSWRDELLASRDPSLAPTGESMEDWEQALMTQAIDDEADAARDQALASFFGEPNVPSLRLPQPIERSINRIIASL